MLEFIGKRQKQGAAMTYVEFSSLVARQPDGVVLLEGRRAILECDAVHAESLGRMLAARFPRLRFRTGNALGADEAFSKGVVSVDATRLQVVLPYAGHRSGARRPSVVYASLDALPDSWEEKLAAKTIAASGKYRSLIGYRNRSAAMAAKAAYLMRDTLKAVGWRGEFPRPICACFYVDAHDPEAGGTGHTIRACRREGVPVVFQAAWRKWDGEG
ncbi:hypothetical protein [Desulfonatronum thiodismutans]|uniref:hypothetical protein n=1 Tax=Desulfonatronum thiodismutans TaxID=159290 RepID=UPI0004ABED58|nr:hypothetical protein [Desulfonatronum thiodismutans]